MKHTKRGRTSTMSSGTRNINAFIFLAIDIALSSVRQHSRPEQKVGRPTILPPFLIVPVHLHKYDECRIDDPRAELIEGVEDKDAGGQEWVLERSDCAHSPFRFWTVELAHLSISWSAIGYPDPEKPMSILVMFNLPSV